MVAMYPLRIKSMCLTARKKAFLMRHNQVRLKNAHFFDAFLAVPRKLFLQKYPASVIMHIPSTP
jgi:protein-L-isoaspartate O-methyltransferase